jgi:hypothetical protein
MLQRYLYGADIKKKYSLKIPKHTYNTDILTLKRYLILLTNKNNTLKSPFFHILGL